MILVDVLIVDVAKPDVVFIKIFIVHYKPVLINLHTIWIDEWQDSIRSRRTLQN